MASQVIEFVETQRDILETYLPDSFQLRRDRGWVWVQKIAIWILRKLGCYAVQKELKLTRHVVNTDSLIEALYKQQGEMFKCYHYRGERLLIGPEEFRELTGEDLKYPTSMRLSYNWQEGAEATVCGLKVTIVPWMKGLLVVPGNWRES